MTSPTLTPVGATGALLETEDTVLCAVCPHPLARHDAIGLRFCTATTDGAFDRGCVCRS
jgi:hypothetical protein